MLASCGGGDEQLLISAASVTGPLSWRRRGRVPGSISVTTTRAPRPRARSARPTPAVLHPGDHHSPTGQLCSRRMIPSNVDLPAPVPVVEHPIIGGRSSPPSGSPPSRSICRSREYPGGRRLRSHRAPSRPARPGVVLDEGGDLLNALSTGPGRAGRDGARWLRSRRPPGYSRLRQMEREGVLRFPMVAMNDSPIRRMFDNRYGTGPVHVRRDHARHEHAAGRSDRGDRRVRGVRGGPCRTRPRPRRARRRHRDRPGTRPRRRHAGVHRPARSPRPPRSANCSSPPPAARDVVRAEHFPVIRDGELLANAGHFDVEIDIRSLGGDFS